MTEIVWGTTRSSSHTTSWADGRGVERAVCCGMDVQLRSFVRDHRGEIVERFVQTLVERGLTPRPVPPREVLVDHLEELLDELAEASDTARSHLETARLHADVRYEGGFSLRALVAEYALLREIFGDLARERGASVPQQAWDDLSSVLWASAAVAIETYTRRDKAIIEKARAELEALYVAAPLGFALLDRDLRYRMVNERLARMNGIPVEKHLGRTPMEILPDIEWRPFLEAAEAVMATGAATSDEIETATLADVGPRIYARHVYPIAVGPSVSGVGVIVEDITQARRTQRSRERIIGIVSHDLRNPISAILFACQILFSRDPRPEIASVSARIQRSAARMRDIVEQLYDYARLDSAGKLQLDPQRFDLGELAKRVIEEAQLASGRDGATVDVEVDGDLWVEWDETRAAQVISNLVANALQHGDGTVHVRIAAAGGEITIAVSNGGDPLGDPSAIFEPFQTKSRAHGHLGLGLFITREVVRAHGGAIEARVEQGRTVFRVRLPRRVAA